MHRDPTDIIVESISDGVFTVDRDWRVTSFNRAAEVEAIREALRRNRNNRHAAARELGLHRATFFRKVKALGLTLPGQDGRSRRLTAAGRDGLGNA